jgi:hypothetical protein
MFAAVAHVGSATFNPAARSAAQNSAFILGISVKPPFTIDEKPVPVLTISQRHNLAFYGRVDRDPANVGFAAKAVIPHIDPAADVLRGMGRHPPGIEAAPPPWFSGK